MRERNGIFSSIDPIIFFVWLCLAIAGVFAIFSASNSVDNPTELFDLSQRHARQAMFLVVSAVLMIIILALDYQLIVNSSFQTYLITILLLIATLVIGSKINGAKSWIKLGPLQIQPTEFAKIGTSLFLAWYLSQHDKIFQDWRKTLISFFIIGVPMILVLLQNDTGSTLLFAILLVVLFREGFTPAPIVLGLLLIGLSLLSIYFGFIKISVGIVILTVLALVIFRVLKIPLFGKTALISIIALLWSFGVTTSFSKVLKDYQQERILVLLGMNQDLRGAGYNIWQSKMAIGSGGLLGKGYLNGTQTHGEFVPEVTTDYIFSSIGEEWGFAGSLFVVGLFSLLILRILFLAERQRSNYARIFMYCTAAFFFIHVFINIAMVIGLFPSVGIPLPFFSSGGSSLMAFTVFIAIVLRLDAERLYML